MSKVHRLVVTAAVVAVLVPTVQWCLAASGESTRITDPAEHKRVGARTNPFRAQSEYILKELDIKAGDVVVDIGAGDGWWTERMAPLVGPKGIVHAAEITTKKVDAMKKKYAKIPQIKPYVCPTDGTGLKANSCDLVLLVQTYHHFTKGKRVDYLKHLRTVVKPTGRVAIIEKYTEFGLAAGEHGTLMSRLVAQAETAGWVPVRIELMKGTYHYITILAQRNLFPPEKTGRARRPATPAPEKK